MKGWKCSQTASCLQLREGYLANVLQFPALGSPSSTVLRFSLEIAVSLGLQDTLAQLFCQDVHRI